PELVPQHQPEVPGRLRLRPAARCARRRHPRPDHRLGNAHAVHVLVNAIARPHERKHVGPGNTRNGEFTHPNATRLEIPMRLVYCGLVLFAAVGTAVAQQPEIIQVQSSQRGPAATVLPTTLPAATPTAAAGSVIYHPMASATQCHGGNCCAPEKVCVPEPDVRKINHNCYSKL